MIAALIAFALSLAGLAGICVLAQMSWLEDAIPPPRSHVRVWRDEDGDTAA